MNGFLSAFAIIISILAIFVNQWVTFIPQLGIEFQYHRRRTQVVVAVAAITTAILLTWNNPTTGQIVVLIVVLLLTPLSGFDHASKTLVTIKQPKHAAASAVDWADNKLVLGYALDGKTAVAWLLDTLIPHHLVNDVVDKDPILAAW